MNARERALAPTFIDHRGRRQHRFMESADINAAFREMYRPLRRNVRRGMTIAGQAYALEMDACIPGGLLATTWIPTATEGYADASLLADGLRRLGFLTRLLEDPRPEALVAWVCETLDTQGQPRLRVEVASVDAWYAAEYPLVPGRGWHWRDLLWAPHQRLGPLALA